MNYIWLFIHEYLIEHLREHARTIFKWEFVVDLKKIEVKVSSLIYMLVV